MTQTLDYARPEVCYRGRNAMLRIGAVIAAASAIAAPVLVSVLGWGMRGVVTVGYLIAAALMWRVLGGRSEVWRRTIWGAAMTVHALWTFYIAVNLTHGKPPHSSVYFLIWWGAIAALCLVALVVEPR